MARNIAKRFATMTLIYWSPINGGSGIIYEKPVEFKGFYIGNAQLTGSEPGEFISSVGGNNKNLVLFYMLEPVVNGCVSWKHTISELEELGYIGTSPLELPDVHKIDEVTAYTMLRSKKTTLSNSAFICSVE
jgi:hypothetical protein